MYCCSCQSSFDPHDGCDCVCHSYPEQSAQLQWAGAADLPASLRLSVVTGLKAKLLPLPAALDRRPNGTAIKGA